MTEDKPRLRHVTAKDQSLFEQLYVDDVLIDYWDEDMERGASQNLADIGERLAFALGVPLEEIEINLLDMATALDVDWEEWEHDEVITYLRLLEAQRTLNYLGEHI